MKTKTELKVKQYLKQDRTKEVRELNIKHILIFQLLSELELSLQKKRTKERNKQTEKDISFYFFFKICPVLSAELFPGQLSFLQKEPCLENSPPPKNALGSNL